MNPFPPAPIPGAPLSAAWMSRFLAACRMCLPLEGNGVRISYGTNGAVIHCTAAGGAAGGVDWPFKVRFHTTDDDTTGRWEVRIPTGSVSVGATCEPMNRPAAEANGHDEDGEEWYMLPIDESEGQASTRTVTGSDGTTKTVTYRRWNIVAHVKTSVKVTGVDDLNKPARRLVYFSADKIAAAGETFDAATLFRRWAGDEFSATVGTVEVSTSDGTKGRNFTPLPMPAIAVAGRAKMNFDLVWYFTLDNDGKMTVGNVYTVRNSQAVAGMNVTGDDMTDVSAIKADGAHTIYVRIRTNQDSDENLMEVLVDLDQASDADSFTTDLLIYDKTDLYMADYRASALTNLQVYR